MTGRLIGVGVGPGAPDLLTLRAARLIEAADVLCYPTLAGAPSFARSIVADLIPASAQEIVIDVPMRTDRAPAQEAYDAGARRIAAALDEGRDVVCLCEGDPFLYGSFMYLHARLAPRYAVEVVPGVTSVTAAAARAATPLVARSETFAILAGTLDEDDLARRIDAADSAAILKLGRHLPKVRRAIEAAGLLDRATFVARATLADEMVCPLAEAPDTAPYFSMVLVVKGADPWL